MAIPSEDCIAIAPTRFTRSKPACSKPMSLEEYLGCDAGTDHRYELVNGVLVEMGAENPLNPQIAVFLMFVFADLGWPRSQLAIGHQIEVKSAQATARQPDLVVHSEASQGAIFEDGKLLRLGQPAPLLVIEVVSNREKDRQSRIRDYEEKRLEYGERGISEYWIVDPDRAVVLVLTLQDGEYRVAEFSGDGAIASPTFPELALTAMQVLSAGIEGLASLR